jgi:hypothetical protein
LLFTESTLVPSLTAISSLERPSWRRSEAMRRVVVGKLAECMFNEALGKRVLNAFTTSVGRTSSGSSRSRSAFRQL